MQAGDAASTPLRRDKPHTTAGEAASTPLRRDKPHTTAGEAASTPLRRDTISPWEYAESLARYRELREGRMQRWLDEGLGSCALARADVRRVVEESLMCFDRERYVVYAYVVMPNHVHVLFMPLAGFSVREVLRGWKSFTARRINSMAGMTGAFWQRESWDHLVRNERQFATFLSYIRANDGKKAYDAYENLAVS